VKKTSKRVKREWAKITQLNSNFVKLNMTLLYRFLTICLIVAFITFSMGPWRAIHSISQAAIADDKEQWQQLVKPAAFESYADKLLSGLLKIKMTADSQKDPAQAQRNYQESMNAMPKTVQQLTSPKGFSYLLCGDLSSDPYAKPAGTTGCWALDGKVTWESPTQAKVTFINPETQWQSSVTLSRVGLFTWQAVDMELPAEAIFERYAKSNELKVDKK
jgi:hypothetical protein